MTTNRAEILARVQDIVRNVLDADHVVLTEDAMAMDVLGWDSLAHVRIMVAVEKYFAIRFDVDELSSVENVGELVSQITVKLTQQER